jgi:immune inhibitor A
MDHSASQSSSWKKLGLILGIFACTCLILGLIAAAAAYFFFSEGPVGPGIPGFPVTTSPTMPVARPPINTIPTDTVDALRAVVVPDSDLYDLACRLRDVCNVSHTLPAPAVPYKVGDTRRFWLLDNDTSAYFPVQTTLRYITPHSYFWLGDGVSAEDGDIAALMTAFENKIYPTDREFFGSEWTPGVDNDPHIYVLYVRGVGAATGGYFSAGDEYNPLVRKYSNAAELFVFNADSEGLTDPYTYGTLAHEFQHMIHWSLDHNESGWLNEGFSEVAAFLNGYTVGGHDLGYAQRPDIPLTDWTSSVESPAVTQAHYGQSFLFLTYFLDRFGRTATQALVKDPANSLDSIDDVLRILNITDPKTGRPVTVDDFALDWMTTLYLEDGSVGDGRYIYHNYPTAPRASATQRIGRCPRSPLDGSVSQYGPEYVQITCPGDHTLTFTGSTVTSLLSADPHSGKHAFWSNAGDSSNMTLTHEFDLTGAHAPVSVSYWTWYDLENGYDYLYLEASTDGQHWDILRTPSCADSDLSGNAYGCGYSGKSGGGDVPEWIRQSVDLSRYAGTRVQLRFEYVTDEALNGQGLLLDDLSIPAIGYSTDFESDDGGWKSNGFARIENPLPQTFRLALILQGSGGTTVQQVPMGEDQVAVVPFSLKPGERAVLVVTGTQRYTHQRAGYSIQVN